MTRADEAEPGGSQEIATPSDVPYEHQVPQCQDAEGKSDPETQSSNQILNACTGSGFLACFTLTPALQLTYLKAI